MRSLIRGRRRLASLGLALVVVGGVACTAVTSLRQSSPSSPATTAAPANFAKSAAGQAVPGAVPAPLGAGGPVVSAGAGAAPAANVDARGPQQRPEAVSDSSAQILNRMVIRTAQLTLEIQDVDQAVGLVRGVAVRAGGFVSASSTRIEKVNDQDRMLADLTVQVRSDALDSAMSELRGLGKVTAETSGSQDVTEEYVDLGSNLRNLQATESAILKLMDKATQIQDIVSLQRELTNVRGQIERIQGRQTYLERRTDMATITVALRLPGPPSVQPLGAGWDPLAVALRGWQASLNLLRGVVEVLIIAVAFSWWLIPLVAVGVYIWTRRRRPTPAPAPDMI